MLLVRLNSMAEAEFEEEYNIFNQICFIVYMSHKHQITYVDYLYEPIRFLLVRSSRYWTMQKCKKVNAQSIKMLEQIVAASDKASEITDQHKKLARDIIKYGLSHIKKIHASLNLLNSKALNNDPLTNANQWCCLCLPTQSCCLCRHFAHVGRAMNTLKASMGKLGGM
ncbi:hypothetical protein GUITHDRAFT_148087 [Guillardia theta CCMP2712]|uniref:Uncharacterized protein n=1 Tax=Guillardia theta (strain CCMP2712) TaxID=905079 RepID=L1IAU3_GUITC|nr:hypothetical protein GUITHDRAFT_148087 [Guillardia theta CCMP2712]EKX33217.1 hypothetical protein GUITHDRAFT_148087 [Guillardia theta CCMP2712]|mmetsp:Transcript_46810/g.146759  ORF Transcript_46810/g.146759 Transcript_46810/m.146759 type:complete len:168 (-) Transcript_46810:299-802(-)|eukprot:XP_005820197.1 hypothetical protein GUITHDRAFT_148087 [Guillardia theta CCMP2712]